MENLSNSELFQLIQQLNIQHKKELKYENDRNQAQKKLLLDYGVGLKFISHDQCNYCKEVTYKGEYYDTDNNIIVYTYDEYKCSQCNKTICYSCFDNKNFENKCNECFDSILQF